MIAAIIPDCIRMILQMAAEASGRKPRKASTPYKTVSEISTAVKPLFTTNQKRSSFWCLVTYAERYCIVMRSHRGTPDFSFVILLIFPRISSHAMEIITHRINQYEIAFIPSNPKNHICK